MGVLATGVDPYFGDWFLGFWYQILSGDLGPSVANKKKRCFQ